MIDVLLVDGNAGLLHCCAMLLQAEGFRVAIAPTGHEALRRAAQAAFDVTVIALRLPDMRGTELIRRAWRARNLDGSTSRPESCRLGAVICVEPGLAADDVLQLVREVGAGRASMMPRVGPSAPSNPSVVGALRHIAERFRDPSCRASSVASSLGISEEHLCRLVKSETGRTIGSFVHELRLVEAGRLLRTTPLTVKEIAHLVGYSGTSHLERHFRGLFGVTPLAVRRAVGAERTSIKN